MSLTAHQPESGHIIHVQSSTVITLCFDKGQTKIVGASFRAHQIYGILRGPSLVRYTDRLQTVQVDVRQQRQGTENINVCQYSITIPTVTSTYE